MGAESVPEKYARICSVLLDRAADTRARTVAQWEAAADFARAMPRREDAPKHPQMPWIMHGRDISTSWLKARDERDLIDAISDDRYAFGCYRSAVLDLEGRNARSLHELGQHVRLLERLAALPSARTDVISPLLANAADWLAREWRTDLPDGDLRSWSMCASRRYDLAPVFWRYLVVD